MQTTEDSTQPPITASTQENSNEGTPSIPHVENNSSTQEEPSLLVSPIPAIDNESLQSSPVPLSDEDVVEMIESESIRFQNDMHDRFGISVNITVKYSGTATFKVVKKQTTTRLTLVNRLIDRCIPINNSVDVCLFDLNQDQEGLLSLWEKLESGANNIEYIADAIKSVCLSRLNEHGLKWIQMKDRVGTMRESEYHSRVLAGAFLDRVNQHIYERDFGEGERSLLFKLKAVSLGRRYRSVLQDSSHRLFRGSAWNTFLANLSQEVASEATDDGQ
jgi:hypothetical protein